MPVVIFSHHDLDGVGCTVIMKRIHPDAICFNVGYGEAHEAIRMFVESYGKVAKMYVTDLALEQQTIEMLNEYYTQDRIVELHLIDHHKSTMRFAEHPWIIVDTQACATKLLARYFNAITPETEPFIEAVDAYDRWVLDSAYRKAGEDLNTLFGLINVQRFQNRFEHNLDIHLNPVEAVAVMNEIKRVDEYVKSVVGRGKVIDSAPIKYLLTMGNMEQASEIGHLGLERNPDVEFVLNIDQRWGKGGLRSNGYDVTRIAEMFGGGGHPQSAGFQLNAENLGTELPETLSKIENHLRS